MRPFQPLTPYNSGMLELPDGACVHYEESGTPEGIPVVLLHGGPGSGARPHQRRFFDPGGYRIIAFDQRGCGRSTPAGGLDRNTTADLAADMEVLRAFLGVDRWVVFGGSWGATLALYYAQRHPTRVLALVVRGTVLGRRGDLDWLFGGHGVARIFPEAYREFLETLPQSQRHRPVEGFATLLNGSEGPERAEAAADAWARWEDTVTMWRAPPATRTESTDEAAARVARYRIAAHYVRNGLFVEPERGVLTEPGRLADIPGVIVHGRRDLICPAENALTLHAAWSRAELRVIADGAHLDSDDPIAAALTEAMEMLRTRRPWAEDVVDRRRSGE